MQYLSLGPSGRGQSSNQVSEPAEPVSFDPLIGRKVKTRWPDDNNFYEAVITDYNKAEVYMILLLEALLFFFFVVEYMNLVVHIFRVDMLLFMT